jgi:multicomponent Na+:H+ antiporter subunit B
VNRRARRWLFLAAAPGLAAVLLSGMNGLAPLGRYPGPYGDLLNAVAVPERHVTNVVAAVNFDYRGFDTMGEEFILFASVAGVALLLRARRGESAADPPDGEHDRLRQRRSDAVRWLGPAMIGLTSLFGLYVVFHGQLTPGGGFQGGVILGTGSILAYLTTRYRAYRRLVPKPWVDIAGAVGAGAYVAIGLAAVACGGAFLQNVLPLGQTGALVSSGTILLINLAVALEVTAGFTLLFIEFLEETRTPGPGEDA